MLRRSCLLKHVIEGKMEGRSDKKEEEKDVSSYWMTLRKREDTEFESGSTRSHCVENSL
jgi:hypothetical protein